MRTLVFTFETLVDIPALAMLILSKPLRACRIPAGETILEKFHILRTGASVTSENVDAFMRTIVLILETLVHIQAGFLVLLQDISLLADAPVGAPILLAGVTAIRDFARVEQNAAPAGFIQGHIARTPALVSALLVLAFMRAPVRSFRALVHVDAGSAIGIQDESRMTGAFVSAVQIHASVLATVIIPAALVHVGTVIFTRVLEDLQTVRARASKTAFEINARMRTRSVPGALVDIRAGRTVVRQLVSSRANASRSLRGVLADVGTRFRQAEAVLELRALLDASRVVVRQREP